MVRAPAQSALLSAFADAGQLWNDIVSYRRETQIESAIGGGVTVMQRFLDCDGQQAVDFTNELANVRLRAIAHIVERELPEVDDPDVMRYAEGLQDWLAGAHHWSLETGRYDATVTQSRSSPAGLGTSGARAGLPPMEPAGLEPATSCLQSRRSPS